MKPQAAMLDPAPAHARHLFLDLNLSAHPRAALRMLAIACDGRTVVLGLGGGVADAGLVFLAFGKSFDADEV